MTPNDIPQQPTRPIDLPTSVEAHERMFRVYYSMKREQEQAQVKIPKEDKAEK